MSVSTLPRTSGSARPCRCGHTPTAHSHYRRGTDCGVCGAVSCSQYHASRPATGRALLTAALTVFTAARHR
jgi:hypothetical protein